MFSLIPKKLSADVYIYSPLISTSMFFTMFMKIGRTHGIFWTASFDTLAKSLDTTNSSIGID
jgi:hypothetical protein